MSNFAKPAEYQAKNSSINIPPERKLAYSDDDFDREQRALLEPDVTPYSKDMSSELDDLFRAQRLEREQNLKDRVNERAKQAHNVEVRKEDERQQAVEKEKKMRKSTTLDPQIEQTPTKSSGGSSESKKDVFQIRDVPKTIFDIMCEQMAGLGKLSKTKQLVAYVYAVSGTNCDDLPDDVQAVIKDYQKEKPLKAIQNKLLKHDELLHEIKLLTTYMMLDTVGLSTSRKSSVATLDFIEPGVEDAMKRLEEQAQVSLKHERVRKGRPVTKK